MKVNRVIELTKSEVESVILVTDNLIRVAAELDGLSASDEVDCMKHLTELNAFLKLSRYQEEIALPVRHNRIFVSVIKSTAAASGDMELMLEAAVFSAELGS